MTSHVGSVATTAVHATASGIVGQLEGFLYICAAVGKLSQNLVLMKCCPM